MRVVPTTSTSLDMLNTQEKNANQLKGTYIHYQANVLKIT